MAAASQRPKLVAVVGPTASGKSELALRLAKEFDGEIIAADSRTIYKGMDIGTAKPGKSERKLVHHWGLDLVEPGEPFSVYQFKKYAEKIISDIQNRGKLPILVGGTGLYIDAILFDFGFVSAVDSKEREYLEKLPTDELRSIIKRRDYMMPINRQNRRHLIRTIERRGKPGSRRSLKSNVLLIGLMPHDGVLKKSIASRAEGIFQKGVVAETEELHKEYGEAAIGQTAGLVYKICARLLKGEIKEDEAIEEFKIADWQYAKRQKTWFRRNKYIQWFESPQTAFVSVKRILNK